MYWVMAEQKKVYDYEKDHVLAPLCGTLAALQITGVCTCVHVCVMCVMCSCMCVHVFVCDASWNIFSRCSIIYNGKRSFIAKKINLFCSVDTSPSVPSGRMSFHPKLMSGHELEILRSKSHLVIRMVQLKIGQDLLFQVCTPPVPKTLLCYHNNYYLL